MMSIIKNFTQFNESFREYEGDKDVGTVRKSIEIRFDIDESKHVWDDRESRVPLEDDERHEAITELVEISIEQLTIDLMKGHLNITKKFVIRSYDISLICKLKGGEDEFKLIIISLWDGRSVIIHENQYVYDIDDERSYIFRHQQLHPILELNHQMTGHPLGVNQPGFGQGAHLGNWGADFGNPSQGVRGTFGNKGDKQDPNLPQKYKQPTFASVVLDPTTGRYIHEEDIQKLLSDYTVRCRQNSEEPQEFRNIDSKTVEFIQNYLNK